jgi:hypothetical protein
VVKVMSYAELEYSQAKRAAKEAAVASKEKRLSAKVR